MSKLELVEGAYYRRRDGRVVGPLRRDPCAAGAYGWRIPSVAADGYFHITTKGKVFPYGESDQDLVEKVDK